MKKYLAILKISLLDSFAYRGDVLLFTLSGVVHPLMMLAIWLAVVASGGKTPLSQTEFIQYYVALLVVKLWVGAWAAQYISQEIRHGKISPFLVRPVPYIYFQLGNNIGEKIVKFVYVIPVVAGLMFLFQIVFPILQGIGLISFIISWIMAFILTFVIDQCIGILAFWLDDIQALGDGYDFLIHIFSGQLIPLFALPQAIQKISSMLPFRYTLSLPLEILLGKLTMKEIFIGLSTQTAWLVFFIISLWFLWKKGVVQYSAVGA